MIYVTGDIHRKIGYIYDFYYEHKIGKKDILIILGDAGINIYNDSKDLFIKEQLSNLPFTILCIHGNHENRPENIKSYKAKMWNKGIIYYEKRFPNILFAKDGQVYNICGHKTLVIGGAYSIDRDFRILYNYPYFSDEQPSNILKEYILEMIKHDNKYDLVLTHTCPYKYIPKEMFLDGILQSKVDNTTELFLDTVEKSIKYKKWLCGHFHTNKKIDKMVFLYHDIIKIRNKISKL